MALPTPWRSATLLAEASLDEKPPRKGWEHALWNEGNSPEEKEHERRGLSRASLHGETTLLEGFDGELGGNFKFRFGSSWNPGWRFSAFLASGVVQCVRSLRVPRSRRAGRMTSNREIR